MPACQRCGSINEAIARFCSACGRTLTVDRLDHTLRQQEASVLFADLVDSTNLLARLGAQRFRELQQRYFVGARECVEAHSGVVEKYIGDAVMAVFGVFDPYAHADEALSAALDIVHMTHALMEERDLRDIEVAVRVGIDSGTITVGDPITGQVLATGDLVVRAARLQQHGNPGEVAVSYATKQLLQEDRSLADVRADKSVFAIRPRPEPALKLLRTPPFVGREADMAMLEKMAEEPIGAGFARCVVIDAPAGAGKTRLARQLQKRFPEGSTMLGRCLPYGGDGLGWFAVAEILDDFLYIHPNDPGESVGDKISAFKRRVNGKFSERALLDLCGYSDEAPPLESGASTFAQVVEACASQEPCMVVFQDCQWARQHTIRLIQALLGIKAKRGLLILCLSRDPAFASLIGHAEVKQLHLDDFPQREMVDLVQQLTGEQIDLDGVSEHVAALSGGNPLLLQECLWLRLHSPAWEETVAELAASPSRNRLRDVIARRLAMFEAERDVLEIAAVRGNVFWRGAVLASAPQAKAAHYNASLARLTRNGVIRFAYDDRDDWFSFRHQVFCEEAYKAIPEERGRELHDRYGQWLERSQSEQWIYRAMVDYHFARAKGHLLPEFVNEASFG